MCFVIVFNLMCLSDYVTPLWSSHYQIHFLVKIISRFGDPV